MLSIHCEYYKSCSCTLNIEVEDIFKIITKKMYSRRNISLKGNRKFNMKFRRKWTQNTNNWKAHRSDGIKIAKTESTNYFHWYESKIHFWIENAEIPFQAQIELCQYIEKFLNLFNYFHLWINWNGEYIACSSIVAV